MCCEICPRYTNCEEEGHLNEMCCISCPDHSSCYNDKRSGNGKSQDENEDEF